MNLKDKLKPPMPIFYNGCINEQAFADWYNRRIEPLFKNAAEVTTPNPHGIEFLWGKRPLSNDTHRALLIGIEPIKKGVSKEYLLQMLRCGDGKTTFEELADRIELEGLLP